jgi:hypothetical protein
VARRRLCLATFSGFGRHPNSGKRATEWIQPGGINRSAACLTLQVMFSW